MFSWREIILEKLHQRKRSIESKKKKRRKIEKEIEIHQCVKECEGNDKKDSLGRESFRYNTGGSSRQSAAALEQEKMVNGFTRNQK